MRFPVNVQRTAVGALQGSHERENSKERKPCMSEVPRNVVWMRFPKRGMRGVVD